MCAFFFELFSWLFCFRIPRAAMNKLIMNYLVTEGFKDAAEKFKEESGVNPEQNLDLLDNRIKIRDSVQHGNILEAISLGMKIYLLNKMRIDLIIS